MGHMQPFCNAQSSHCKLPSKKKQSAKGCPNVLDSHRLNRRNNAIFGFIEGSMGLQIPERGESGIIPRQFPRYDHA
jgi:hypothetical protein